MREAEPIPVRTPADIGAPPRGPARRRPLAPSDYPSSDGKPMAETDVHWDATVNVASPLKTFYRDRPDVYVGSDMLMYYQESERGSSVAPDVFVTFGVPKLPKRDTWLIWVEGKGPDFVLEVTSRHTRGVDEGRKRQLYAELGVPEYWQFDPTGDYLDPVLKGSRLENGRYRELVLEKRGSLLRQITVLGLEFRLDGDQLRLFDPKRKEYLGNHEETTVERNEARAERDDFRNAWQASEAERDGFKNAWRISESEHDKTRSALQASEAERTRAEARIRELERRLGDD